MASIIDDPNGRRRIQFVAPDGSRKAIRLGKIDRKSAEAINRHVEGLLSAKMSGQPVPRDTASWLTGISEPLKQKLAAVGLIEASTASVTIDDLLATYLARGDVKVSTKSIRKVWGERLRENLGNRPIASITAADANALRDALIRRGLAGPTVGRVLRFARQLFTIAVNQDMITRNPFDGLAHNFREGPGRQRDYAVVEEVNRLLEVCTPAWRVLIALARFGGLRSPSETLLLKWADVDLPGRKMTVSSPKTENQGKAWRVVPITPPLARILEEAWMLADGEEFVVALPQYRLKAGNWVGCNLRSQLARLMKRAGVPSWTRPFRLFRSSCVTDWAREHPIAAVASWAGHTVPVAGKHYLTITDEDFMRATGVQGVTQKAAQQIAENSRTEQQSGEHQNPEVVVGTRVSDYVREDAKVGDYPARIRT